ncbi:hypothetical protein [Elizabethkingia meningoseptica]|uniref:hypothetical protein n=1 Tax=Elizabethkingia meningoseptica TaxID=238 RepID=UPI00301889FC
MKKWKTTLNKYSSELKGTGKNEVLCIMGEEFNFYPAKEWNYTLKKYWWGKKIILCILFNDSDIVRDVYIDVKWEM